MHWKSTRYSSYVASATFSATQLHRRIYMGHLLYTLALANRSKNRSNPHGMAVDIQILTAHGIKEMDSWLQEYFPEEAIDVVNLKTAAPVAQGSAGAPGQEEEEPLQDMDAAMWLLDEEDSNPASHENLQPLETSTPGAGSAGEAKSGLVALSAISEALPGLLTCPPDSSPPLEVMETSEVKVKETPFTLVAKKPHIKKQSKS